ncbi:MAG: PKD domain-containing protein [Cecembia sp.]
MSSKVLGIWLLLGLMVLSHQKALGQLSTVGKEFRFGFMENFRVVNFNNPNNSALDYGIVLITAAEEAEGFIQYQNRRVDFKLQEGEEFFYKIEDEDMLLRTSGVVENKSVYVLSSGNISVYAFNERLRSADGTVVLPVSSLGKEYYVKSHFEIMTAPTSYNYSPNVNDESLFMVVAVEDNTQIEITPSVFTLSGNQPNIPFTITLNAGQSYQVKSKADLTGTRVRVVGDNPEDCKNIAAFGGNKWTSVGNCGGANDHLFQQLYPVKTWGTEYLHVAMAGRSSGELVKVLAAENNTNIFVDGQNVGTLEAGKFLTLDFGPDVVKSIKTSKPSSVTVFSKSQECNQPNDPLFGDGDPFMISYSPNEQLLTAVTFNAIQLPVVTAHYVNIIVKTEAVGITFLDNQNIANRFAPFPQSPEFSYARVNISQGVHRIRNEDGFIAYVYGFGDVESYGYAAGASLNNLNFEVSPNYDFEVEGDRVACLGQEGIWEIFPDNEVFTYFLWDFGDGSALKEGKVVQHTFKEKGEIEVKVIASISPNSCDQQEEVIFKVEVNEVSGEIIGVSSVCPEVEEHLYLFESSDEFSKVTWTLEGGEVLEVNEESGTVKVRWGEANEAAFIEATPYSKEGCPQESVNFPISINRVIQSVIPSGETQICFDPLMEWEYTVTNPNGGRGYEWFIENGTLLENTGGTVRVKWEEPSVVGKIWYREFSLIDELCEGIAPILEVNVAGVFEFLPPDVLDVACFGEGSGAISLNIKGGVQPFNYLWSHDSGLNAPEATGLFAGTYSVKVQDAIGCEILSEEIEIVAPEPLALALLENGTVSCFGIADGTARALIEGGVAPYAVNDETAIIQGNEILFQNLEGKTYVFEIRDANNCMLPIRLEIATPDPEIVEVLLQKPSCPGQSNGELLVIPETVFGPFTYTWEFNDADGMLLTGLSKGIYPVEVMDNRGCISVGLGEVKEEAPKVRMPNAFLMEDGLFEGVANCEVEFVLTVYNRWGQLVYSGRQGWDGRIKGAPAPMGTYSYLYQYAFVLDDQPVSKEIRGIFTLFQ